MFSFDCFFFLVVRVLFFFIRRGFLGLGGSFGCFCGGSRVNWCMLELGVRVWAFVFIFMSLFFGNIYFYLSCLFE